MKRKVINAAAISINPNLLWNEFISILAHASYEDLSDEQRGPYLVFWYESEVQNGGHLQYFVNRDPKQVEATVDVLHDMGAVCQGQLLEQALLRFTATARRSPTTPLDFVEEARRGEFSDIDEKFFACSKSLTQVLEGYLQVNSAVFIQVE